MQLIKSGLDALLGEERFKQVRESRAYSFAVDSASMSAFWLPVTITNEIIAGLSAQQIFWSRLMGTAVNVIIAPPYSAMRGAVYRGLGMSNRSHWASKYAVDTVLQVPFLAVYYGIMRTAGADHDSSVNGVIQIAPLCAALGRPQGWFMDQARYQADLPTSYDLSNRSTDSE